MQKNKANSPPITLAFIKSIEDDISRVDAEIKEDLQAVKKKQEYKDKMLQMLQVAKGIVPSANEKRAYKKREIIPKKNVENKKLPTDKRRKEGTWTSTMLEIIELSDKGITRDDLKEKMKKTHFADKLSETESSFYGAIDKLYNKKMIIKHKGYLFSLPAYAKFQKDVSAGLIKDVEMPIASGRGRGSPAGDVIVSFLKNKPNGAISKELKKELSKHKELAESLKHSSFMYNVLSSLIKKEIITKEGGSYRVVS